jgi:hypothetical protein
MFLVATTNIYSGAELLYDYGDREAASGTKPGDENYFLKCPDV